MPKFTKKQIWEAFVSGQGGSEYDYKEESE